MGYNAGMRKHIMTGTLGLLVACGGSDESQHEEEETPSEPCPDWEEWEEPGFGELPIGCDLPREPTYPDDWPWWDCDDDDGDASQCGAEANSLWNRGWRVGVCYPDSWTLDPETYRDRGPWADRDGGHIDLVDAAGSDVYRLSDGLRDPVPPLKVWNSFWDANPDPQWNWTWVCMGDVLDPDVPLEEVIIDDFNRTFDCEWGAPTDDIFDAAVMCVPRVCLDGTTNCT